MHPLSWTNASCFWKSDVKPPLNNPVLNFSSLGTFGCFLLLYCRQLNWNLILKAFIKIQIWGQTFEDVRCQLPLKSVTVTSMVCLKSVRIRHLGIFEKSGPLVFFLITRTDGEISHFGWETDDIFQKYESNFFTSSVTYSAHWISAYVAGLKSSSLALWGMGNFLDALALGCVSDGMGDCSLISVIVELLHFAGFC